MSVNESEKPIQHEKIKNATCEILSAIGENPKREGLIETPDRVARSFDYLTSGYNENVDEIINDAIFHDPNNGMVIVEDIEMYSLCEHHMLPFYGKACVAYLPNEKIIGISKIPRIVDMFSRRLQVQERLTDQISECLWNVLQPQGVAVVIKAKHFCMMMRGVQKQNSSLTTSSMLGVFQTHQPTRMEFLNLIGNNM